MFALIVLVLSKVHSFSNKVLFGLSFFFLAPLQINDINIIENEKKIGESSD